MRIRVLELLQILTRTKNTHNIEANGKFGKLTITVENVPDPTNPKTSRLATLSAIELLRQICTEEIQIGM